MLSTVVFNMEFSNILVDMIYMKFVTSGLNEKCCLFYHGTLNDMLPNVVYNMEFFQHIG